MWRNQVVGINVCQVRLCKTNDKFKLSVSLHSVFLLSCRSTVLHALLRFRNNKHLVRVRKTSGFGHFQQGLWRPTDSLKTSGMLQQTQLKRKQGWEDLQVTLKISSNPKPLMIEMPHEDLNLGCPFGLLVTCNSSTNVNTVRSLCQVRTLTYPWFCMNWAVWRLSCLCL